MCGRYVDPDMRGRAGLSAEASARRVQHLGAVIDSVGRQFIDVGIRVVDQDKGKGGRGCPHEPRPIRITLGAPMLYDQSRCCMAGRIGLGP